MSKQPTSNVTLSGVSEFDYLGGTGDKEEADDAADEDELNPTRKSLEKDFKQAAEDSAEGGASQNESPVQAPPEFDGDEEDDEGEMPEVRLNPVQVF